MSDGGFRGSTAFVAGTLAVGSFVFLVLAGIFAPEDVELRSAQADVYSRSAIGQHAFVELLRERGVPVTLSRWDSARRAGDSAALVLLEPRWPGETERGAVQARMQRTLGDARRVLLVLPKWRGEPDPATPAHLGTVSFVPEAYVRDVLSAAAAGVAFARLTGDGPLSCDGGAAPILTAPQLLVPHPALRALVSCAGGVLLGELPHPRGGRLLVLSDPDVLSNHGLGRGANARVAWAAVERVGAGRRPLLIDAAAQGFEKPPSLGRELFAFPLLPALVQALLALAAWLWAAAVRVGRPLAAPAMLAPGKGLLVDATLALLRRGGHAPYLLRRYRDEVFHEVARARRAAPADDTAALAVALSALRAACGDDPRALHERVERLAAGGAGATEVLAVARRLHRYREELTRGAE